MHETGNTDEQIREALIENMGDQIDNYLLPPPVFDYMGAEYVDFDRAAGTLSIRFPIRPEYRNPYGAMQGGMVAAAVDNTLGPLSVLVAPPNVTRMLEMTYSYPVDPAMEYFTVHARFTERNERRLFFKAEVKSPEGRRLARAKAVHYIL